MKRIFIIDYHELGTASEPPIIFISRSDGDIAGLPHASTILTITVIKLANVIIKINT